MSIHSKHNINPKASISKLRQGAFDAFTQAEFALNKFDSQISSSIELVQSQFVSPQFTAGFEPRHRISWVFGFEEIVFFRQILEDKAYFFEKASLKIPQMSKFCLAEPIIAKMAENFIAFAFDEMNVYMQPIFTDNSVSQIVELIRGSASIIQLALVEQSPQNIALRVLDNWGRVYSLDLNSKFEANVRLVENLAGSTSNIILNFFGKKEPPRANKSLNKLIVSSTKTFSLNFKIFCNSVYASFENKETKALTSFKPKELWENVKLWERDFLAINRFSFIDHKFLDYCLISADSSSLSFLCTYNLYVINKESLDLIITKGRIINFSERRLESVREEILFEMLGGVYDIVNAKMTSIENTVYLAINVSSVAQQKSHNYVIKTDKQLSLVKDKFFNESIFGISAMDDFIAPNKQNCIIFFKNRYENFEREGVLEILSIKEQSLLKEQNYLEISKSLKKIKQTSILEESKLKSREKEVDFKMSLENLFIQFLGNKIDEESARVQLEGIEQKFSTENVYEEIKKLIYQIVEEKSRDLILAVKFSKEDLMLVQKIKEEKGNFDDIISVELKKKAKKLDSFMQLLSLNENLASVGLLVDEYLSLKESLLVLSLIRAFERSNIKDKDFTHFFEQAISATLVKWKLQTSKFTNSDVFYTNVISGHEIFKSFNELLASMTEIETAKKMMNCLRDLWIKVMKALWHYRGENQYFDPKLTLLFRKENNLFHFLYDFYEIYKREIYNLNSSDPENIEKYIEFIKLLIYEANFQKRLFFTPNTNFKHFIKELFGLLNTAGKQKDAFALSFEFSNKDRRLQENGGNFH